MTEKRFIIIGDSNIEFIMQTQLLLPIYDNKKRLNLKSCCDLLNEQDARINELEKENEQLKQQIKELEVDLKMARIDGAIDRMAQRPMKW